MVDKHDYPSDSYVSTLDGLHNIAPKTETDGVVPDPSQFTTVITLDRAASIVGGIVALFVICVLTIRVHQQLRILRATVDAPSELDDAVRHVASHLGVRPPRVAVTRRIESPAICCLGRPVLLWPTSMTSPRAIAESSGVLAHELAHLKRGDPWILFLELLVTVACWWNPLLWLIRRQLHETRELACDGLALVKFGHERGVYARKLLNLSIAGRGSLVLAPAFGAKTVSRRFLKRRLTMVFDDRVQGRVSIRGVSLTLLLAVICLPSLATAFPQTSGSTGISAGGIGVATSDSASEDNVNTGITSGDLFRYIAGASASAGASAGTSSASADVGSADATAEPSSTGGASSSDAVSDDPRPTQRSPPKKFPKKLLLGPRIAV